MRQDTQYDIDEADEFREELHQLVQQNIDSVAVSNADILDALQLQVEMVRAKTLTDSEYNDSKQ